MEDAEVDRHVAGIVKAPWSPATVETLNVFQSSGRMHPFTCGSEDHVSSPVLVATRDGWVCPSPECDYRQDWAHRFMTNRSMFENRGVATILNRRLCTDVRPCGDPGCRACHWRVKTLEAQGQIRELSKLRQKLMGALRILKSPVEVTVEDVTTWVHSLVMSGKDTTLQGRAPSAHEEPKRAVWIGPVLSPTPDRPMTFKVALGKEEYPVDVNEQDEKEFLMQVAAAHAGRSSRDDWRVHRASTD